MEETNVVVAKYYYFEVPSACGTEYVTPRRQTKLNYGKWVIRKDKIADTSRFTVAVDQRDRGRFCEAYWKTNVFMGNVFGMGKEWFSNDRRRTKSSPLTSCYRCAVPRLNPLGVS